MTRKGSRFAQVAAQQAAQSLASQDTIGAKRERARDEAARFKHHGVWLPNPDELPEIDRYDPQTPEQGTLALGSSVYNPRSFLDLIRGDAGADKSYYRRTTLFMLQAPPASRTSAIPYSNPIGLATWRSADGRPRFIHASLFNISLFGGTLVGQFFPIPDSSIMRFADGIQPIDSALIPPGTNVAFGVPLVGTVKFRVMVEDESGQRFFDVDVIGSRSINVYGFGLTVFVLTKPDGYEVDRQRDNEGRGPGLVQESIVGSRIIPLRSNETKNINNRSVSIVNPGGGAESNIPIPPGSKKTQGYSITPFNPADYTITFRDGSVVGTTTEFGVDTNVGVIDFNAGQSRTAIYDIPNANVIRIESAPAAPSQSFNFVFEESS